MLTLLTIAHLSMPKVVSAEVIAQEIVDHKTLIANNTLQSPNKSPKLVNSQSKAQLITQEREGERQIFEIPVDEDLDKKDTPALIDSVDTVEVIADRQEFNNERQVITAEGNVLMRFAEAVLVSDRIQINLADRVVVAEGNVTLTRGEQILNGDRFEYFLVQDQGVIKNAQGQIDSTTLNRDLTNRLPQDQIISQDILSERLILNQPLTDVEGNERVQVNLGSNRDLGILQNNQNQQQGSINRIRFRADEIQFEGSNWQAVNLSLTNDPFSPPELEVRAETAKFERTSPLVSKLTTTKSRLVIDDAVRIPFLKNTFVFDSRPRSPGLFNFGFDGEERGGLFIEKGFKIIDSGSTIWTITPQYFLQRAIDPDLFGFSDEGDGGFLDPATFGVKTRFNTAFSPRNSLRSSASITSFDADQFEDNLRATISANRLFGNLNNPHSFSLEANFRERLFNGSLGFQTVQSSFGGILTSPNITLGKTGIGLQYQVSIQNITSDSDDQDLIGTGEDEDRANLTRYQGAVFLGKSFGLWQGKPLPATRELGLRYSPAPVVPFLQLNTGASGVSSIFSSNDTQSSLRGSIGIQGQFGHFSSNWFDYTGFNVTYGFGLIDGESPFLFDRDEDVQTLAFGINQQLYGPFRFGFQTSLNLDNGEEISTDFVLEYSRRTHGITLRYNPVLELGSFSFNVNDFVWRGNPSPFTDNDIKPVIQGIER